MNIKLLIAEDSTVAAAIMENQVHRRDPDMVVLVCNSVECVLGAVGKFQPDVIVLDLTLVDSGWQETLNAIPGIRKERKGPVKIIVTTASTEVTKEIALSTGADDFMPKLIGQTGKEFVKRITDLCLHP